jgi:hypothetical protein
MKKYILLVSLVLFSTAGWSGETIDETLDVKPEGRIYIELVRGDIVIKGWNKNQVKVSGELDDEAEDYLRYSCMVGEELGSNFGPGEFGFAYPYMLEIKNGSSAAGYSTVGFSANKSFIVDSLFDWNENWPTDSIKSYINSKRYSIINHLGHANTGYVMKMYNKDVDALKNKKFMQRMRKLGYDKKDTT